MLSVQVLTSRGQSQIGNSFHRDQWVQEYLLETKKRSFSHTEKTHDSYKSTSTVRHYNQVRPFSLPYVYVGMIQEWLYNQRKTNLWSVRGQLKVLRMDGGLYENYEAQEISAAVGKDRNCDILFRSW